MEEVKETVDEERQAKLQMWDYAFGFTPMAVLKYAIHLQIADLLDAHGGAITHSDLSAAIGGSPEVLCRIMAYLINRRFFKQTALTPDISYARTPLSRLLIKNGSDDSMTAILMLESSPMMLNPWHRLSSRVLENGGDTPFEAENGKNIWEYYNRENPAQCKLFNDGMACMACHSMAAIIDQYPEAFDGVGSVVDVGGGDGAALRTLIKACPWIHGINLDQPHVVAAATKCEGVEHISGDMCDAVSKADAAFLLVSFSSS